MAGSNGTPAVERRSRSGNDKSTEHQRLPIRSICLWTRFEQYNNPEELIMGSPPRHATAWRCSDVIAGYKLADSNIGSLRGADTRSRRLWVITKMRSKRGKVEGLDQAASDCRGSQCLVSNVLRGGAEIELNTLMGADKGSTHKVIVILGSFFSPRIM